MEKITAAQIQKIHAQLNTLGLLSEKADYIQSFSQGRVTSTKDLLMAEATDLIKHLAQLDPREAHIKAVKHLAYTAKIIYGDTTEDYKMNDAKLDKFLREKGAVKKALKSQSLAELITTHKQFEAIIRNNKKAADNKQAKTATKKLLEDIGLTVSGTR